MCKDACRKDMSERSRTKQMSKHKENSYNVDDFLNKHERKRYDKLRHEWNQRSKAERPFKCPGCGTRKSLDLVYIRRDHVDCIRCGNSFATEELSEDDY